MTTTMFLLVLAGVLLVAYLIRREARLRWLRGKKTSADYVLNLVLRSTALAAGSISLGAAIFQAMSTEAHVVLLSLGLFSIALTELRK
jgi:hypothetical protein